MKTFKKVTDVLAKAAEIICMLMISALVVMIVAELMNRNFLNKSFRASIEICGIAFLWMAFIGIIPLYHRSGLMRLEFLSSRLKGVVAEIIYFANKTVSLMLGVIMVVAFFAQYPYVSTRFYATIPWLPYTIQYIPMAIAGVYIALHTVYQLLERIVALKNGAVFTQKGENA